MHKAIIFDLGGRRFSTMTGSPQGGFQKFVDMRTDGDPATLGDETTLATWLHDAGYLTGRVGKYLVGYPENSTYIPPGWDEWFGTYGGAPGYYNYGVNDNGRVIRFGDRPEDYSTDVLTNRVISFLDQAELNDAQPFFYKVAGYWGGLDGSIMFWVALLALFGSSAVYVNRQRHRLLIPWVVATISVVEMFFLFLMVIHNNPFETFPSSHPSDGQGLNPLLQNYYMAIHPPMLYIGFVGMTIPFAFGIAALASGQLDGFYEAGANGVALVSAILSAPEPRDSAREIISLLPAMDHNAE
jgi:hypothetical protein